MPRAGLSIESQAPIIQELERCAVWAYHKFGGERSDLPSVTISIQTRGKKHLICGSFKHEAWSTMEGETVHEILITSERLFADPMEVYGTVIHEVVHLFNYDAGDSDCSKGGRHNEQFKDTALSFKLEVEEPHDSKGHAYTKPSEELVNLINNDFVPDLTAFTIFQEALPIPVPKVKGPPKVRPWICKCPITVQVATGVELDAKCGVCVSLFELKK